MVRKPIAAGMFYEDYENLLKEEIEACFLDNKFGPGSLPSKKRDKKILGVIAPHAGYKISGAGMAWAYKEIAESEIADVYVILGTNHTGVGKSSTLLDDFETPLGIVKTDIEFAKKLIESGFINENKEAHSNEHSIEVQLPFLQFVNKDQEFRILPIAINRYASYKLLGKEIVKTAKEMNKRIILIASSDFTHFGISYGYMPFSDDIKNRLYGLDKGAIKFIEELDNEGFNKYCDETGATICGRDAISVLISAVKEIGVKEVKLLKYYTSGDITEDYTNAVGYGSILFR